MISTSKTKRRNFHGLSARLPQARTCRLSVHRRALPRLGVHLIPSRVMQKLLNGWPIELWMNRVASTSV